MFFNDFDIDEVFNDYARRMEEQGHLSKKAELAVPKFVVESEDYSEVDVSDELKKIAAKGTGSDRNQFYDVFGKGDLDKLMNDAHPEKSPKVVDAPDNLGVVENLQDVKKRMEDVAQKKAALLEKVLVLATELDSVGLTAIAASLDSAVAKFVKADMGTGAADLPAAEMALTNEDLEQVEHQHMHDKFVSGEKLKAKNLAMLKRINKYLNEAGMETLSESGDLNAQVHAGLAQLGVQPGSYKSWGQLANLVETKGTDLVIAKAPQNTNVPAGAGTNVVRKDDVVEDLGVGLAKHRIPR